MSDHMLTLREFAKSAVAGYLDAFYDVSNASRDSFIRAEAATEAKWANWGWSWSEAKAALIAAWNESQSLPAVPVESKDESESASKSEPTSRTFVYLVSDWHSTSGQMTEQYKEGETGAISVFKVTLSSAQVEGLSFEEVARLLLCGMAYMADAGGPDSVYDFFEETNNQSEPTNV
jgi:hypothetical protein